MKNFTATELSDYLYHPREGFKTVARSIIRDGAQSVSDLCSRTGLYIKTVQYAVRDMREKKVIHVCRWDHLSSCSWRPVYAEGAGRDVPKPRNVGVLARDLELQEQRDHDKVHFFAMIHALAGKPGTQPPALPR